MFEKKKKQFLREKNFKPRIPQVKVKDGEAITYETATTAMKRAAHYFSAIQASDGHWPAENAGPMYFLPPFVSIFFSSSPSHYEKGRTSLYL